MSHELRTPLNSSLILAKLLADNRHGNLTAEQVQVRPDHLLRRATTCWRSSTTSSTCRRSRPGKIELRPEEVSLAAPARRRSARSFPAACADRSAALDFTDRDRSRACPRSLETDAQRLRAGPQEPALERVQVHRDAARSVRAASVGAADDGQRARSRCATPASASRASSSESIFEAVPPGRRHAPAASTAARASACRSRASWRGCSAARSRSRARPGAGSTFTLTPARACYDARSAPAPPARADGNAGAPLRARRLAPAAALGAVPPPIAAAGRSTTTASVRARRA